VQFLSIWFLAGLVGVAPWARPDHMPQALLVSPVNATWAANHLPYWQAKGFDGFALEGIMNDVMTNPWAGDGDPSSTHRDDALLQEVRLACQRLAQGGIGHNALWTSLAPDGPFFIDSACANAAASNMAAASAFCRLAGLTGVVVDSRSTAFFYFYQWDGYDYENVAPEEVANGAEAFGTGLAWAFLNELPAGEIFVICDGIDSAGPLWLRLLEGVIRGVGSSRGARLHLLLRDTAKIRSPKRQGAMVEHVEQILRLHLAPAHHEIWREQGSISLGVAPLATDGRRIMATYPREEFAVQLCSAKTLSPFWVWADAADASWWRIQDNDVSLYKGLMQNGKALASQTGEMRAALARYTMKTPLDALTPVGPDSFGGSPCFVFRSGQTAALALFEGIKEPATAARQEQVLTVTSLCNGEQRLIQPKQGVAAIGPLEIPVLLEGLSIHDYVLPAALHLELASAPSPAPAATPARYGFVNHTGFRLEGALETTVPPALSLTPDSIAFNLAPGEALRVDGVLRGGLEAGERYTLQLALLIPKGPPVTRLFTADVMPALAWQQKLSGPITAPLANADVNADGRKELIACSESGAVAALSGTGEIIWRQQFRCRFTQGAAVGRRWTGRPIVAAVDHRGVLHTLSGDGTRLWSSQLPAAIGNAPPVFQNLHPFPGEELLVALENGVVLALFSNGQTFWEQPISDSIKGLAAGDADADARTECFVGAGQKLYGLDNTGEPMWSYDAKAPLTAGPVLARLDGKGLQLVAGDASGTLHVCAAADGRPIDAARFKDAPAISAILVEDSERQKIEGKHETRVFVAATDGLHALTTGLDEVWRVPMPAARLGAAPNAANGFVLAATAAGELWCVNKDGVVLWRDTRSVGPIAAPPLTADVNNDKRLECLTVSSDGYVRAVMPDEGGIVSP